MTADLPENYPFDPDITKYPGALKGAAAMIYQDTRDYARDDLTVDDFERDPEFEEETLNFALGELREAVQAVGETLAQPGPWHGINPGDDAARAAAEIRALVIKLSIPVNTVEEAIREARISSLERQRGTARHQEGKRWRARVEFEDRVNEAIREAAWDQRPLELRLAHMDLLIAEAQRYRAAILRDHHTDAWLHRRADIAEEDSGS